MYSKIIRMTTQRRSYVSPMRAAAAEEKRARVLEAAGRLLSEEAIAAFSLDAVAKAAGVTRLTVYNQFGSRRGLFEALFDQRALQGGLTRIPEAMGLPDSRAALDRVVEIFCDFWGAEPALGRLHDAVALDPEFAQALGERNERRRRLIAALLERMAGMSPVERLDAVDLIFSLTSYAVFRMLSHDGRTTGQVCRLLQSACRAVCAPAST